MAHRPKRHSPDKIPLEMTPMIDVVFQLLIFFMLTLKIVAIEGDFNIKMPLAPSGSDIPELDLPLTVRLSAVGGDKVAIELDGKALGSFAELRSAVIEKVGYNTGEDSPAAKQEVVLDVDYDLHYRYVIDAITHVRGAPTSEGKFVPLVEKIRFGQQRAPGAAGG
ncbi:MAG: biopolymer transporter ExbD [Planctomycetia bacterium]|nr:biopolymer transporter ExbD [Planctomycetia bacterium]